MKRYLAILFTSIFLLGCNTNTIQQDLVSQLVKAPEIKNIKLTSFSVKEQRAVFDVSLYNPNIYPLPVSALSGDFKLNQVSVGSMKATSDTQLGAQQTQTVTLPVQLNTDALINAAKGALSTQQVNYRFSGGIETSAGKLPVTKAGHLSLTDLMSALLP